MSAGAAEKLPDAGKVNANVIAWSRHSGTCEEMRRAVLRIGKKRTSSYCTTSLKTLH